MSEIHTNRGKRRFIRELCNNIRDGALSKVPEMPKDWDGHELRVYLAEKFGDSASMSILHSKQSARMAEYRNQTLTRNL